MQCYFLRKVIFFKNHKFYDFNFFNIFFPLIKRIVKWTLHIIFDKLKEKGFFMAI